MHEDFHHYDIILGSQSPRRKLLLEDLGIDFSIISIDVEEVFPEHLSAVDAAIYLSELKAIAFPKEKLKENSLLITADTVVSHSDQLLGKPRDCQEAVAMLKLLSDTSHDVITAFTLSSLKRMKSFYSITKVYFKALSDAEIEYYVEHYKPFDKAGAYGIQEWIGKIGIEKIEGSYFNVMGLPIHQVYSELITFEKD